jgi:multidrug efflux pump subunit AcrA (membrane-fusion protein)
MFEKRRLFGGGLVLLGVVAAAIAQDAPKDDMAVGDKPALGVKAKRERLEVRLELKGQFVAREAAVVAYEPEEWSQALELKSVLPHGTTVKAGDVIAELDAAEMDKAIEELTIDLEAGETALEIAQRELPLAERSLPEELKEAERASRVAEEDLARFREVGRPMSEAQARFSLKNAEERLRYSREELRQLEAMYRDKDLTEETEEMILQRTRFEVEGAEFYLGTSKVSTEETLGIELPRQAQTLEEAARKAKLNLERTTATAALQLEQKRLTLKKQVRERALALKKLADLRVDREGCTMKAPRDGTLYFGKCEDGSWTTGAVNAKAHAGEPIQPGDLVFTVVTPGALEFRADVDEKDLHLLKGELDGFVTPTGFPDVTLKARLRTRAGVPSDGKYPTTFDVTTGAAVVVPGMTGLARFEIYAKDDAVVLPESVVSRAVDGSRYVEMDLKEGKTERRKVVTGRSAEGKVEILEGLSEGEAVRGSQP